MIVPPVIIPFYITLAIFLKWWCFWVVFVKHKLFFTIQTSWAIFSFLEPISHFHLCGMILVTNTNPNHICWVLTLYTPVTACLTLTNPWLPLNYELCLVCVSRNEVTAVQGSTKLNVAAYCSWKTKINFSQNVVFCAYNFVYDLNLQWIQCERLYLYWTRERLMNTPVI